MSAGNFSDYWSSLVMRNAGLIDSETKMTITVKEFKAQLQKAYAAGAQDKAAVAAEFQNMGSKSRGPLDDMLEGIFGRDRS